MKSADNSINKRRFNLNDLTLFQLGAFIWLIVTLLGYFVYRTGGGGFYRDGYSLPSMLPMGVDFSAGYKYAVALHGGISEYIKASSAYPPFYTVAVFPLSFFPLHTAYRIYFLVLTLALFIMTYVSLTEIDDLDVTSKILSALVITTLFYFSYPVNFALERGNSDLVAGAFAIISLFAMTRGRFFLSLLALTISTQFKIYPAILIAMLFKRFGIRSIIYFFVFNVIAFLILGVPAFLHFLSALKALATVPATWDGNHSMYSYIFRLVKEGWISSQNENRFRSFSYIAFLGLFCFAYFKSWLPTREKFHGATESVPKYLSGSEIGLIGMCFCLMSLLPAVSYDYKLAIQSAPFLLLISRSHNQLFDFPAQARIVTALVAALVAWLLIPRDMGFVLKTPGLIVLFAVYFYCALFGKKVFPDYVSNS